MTDDTHNGQTMTDKTDTDKAWNGPMKVFVSVATSLLLLGIVQTFALVWWMSRIETTMSFLQETMIRTEGLTGNKLDDHEKRLRVIEQKVWDLSRAAEPARK